ncbi:hydantoinase B/oxoprolinase family protein [Nitratireductor sp. StC3]|uniref:hydantoinase B/oxoprolinase family protein n=1 Tax=Nitratireductor sp. StC3 TaxID=2126741 RepID=UPI000D0D5024|nr:hydantoinase B/oxoprolinase family protein [Nitratireductor sp. StC3]PSM16252.1 hydantoinase B/oxoprolinase [Nitratireductor sp. StC3]
MKLDPVTIEVISRKLIAITDEIYFTVQRTARSSYVNEVADFAVAMLDVNGDVFAYPPSASFNFLIDTNFKSTIDAVPDLRPGDVIITNDPYASEGLSTHLPDVHLIQPYFHDGEIIGYGWSFIHSLDFGGAVPGSVSATSHEIYQEGLRIPPMKLVKGGAMNEELLALIRLNTRVPDITIADFKAMMGALETGNRRYADIIARFGAPTVLQAQTDLLDYTAARGRAVLRRIPDGVYEFWDYLDDDVVTNIPLRVRLRMEVKDGEVLLDLTGTDPETRSAFNVPSLGRRMYWLSFRLTGILTTYDPDIPRNAGLYRSIAVRNQPGSVFDARPPVAVGMRHSAPYRLFDCVTGAVLQANPSLMSAAMGGSMATFRFTEQNEDGSLRVEVVEPLRSGMGAFEGRDGVDGRDNSINNMRNRPIELIEMEQGLRVLRYDINPDSGGPGKWRGGVGQLLVVELTGEAGGDIQISGLERSRMAPWGFAGGKPGALVRAIINEGRPDERPVSKGVPVRLGRGDTVTLRMPGGGGVGDPFERDPAAVETDVRRGFVTAEAAMREYGVAIVDGRVDEAATAVLRAAAPSERNDVFSFGTQRDAWEQVFGDEAMLDLNARLYAAPKTHRHELRRRVFQSVLPGLKDGRQSPLDELVADPAAARARLTEAMDTLLPKATA